jgi:hypothetical protein
VGLQNDISGPMDSTVKRTADTVTRIEYRKERRAGDLTGENYTEISSNVFLDGDHYTRGMAGVH